MHWSYHNVELSHRFDLFHESDLQPVISLTHLLQNDEISSHESDLQPVISLTHLLQNDEISSREKLQQQLDETTAKYEMQITTLNENMTTLRADWMSAQSKQEELEKQTDEIRGEKLGEFWLAENNDYKFCTNKWNNLAWLKIISLNGTLII